MNLYMSGDERQMYLLGNIQIDKRSIKNLKLNTYTHLPFQCDTEHEQRSMKLSSERWNADKKIARLMAMTCDSEKPRRIGISNKGISMGASNTGFD